MGRVERLHTRIRGTIEKPFLTCSRYHVRGRMHHRAALRNHHDTKSRNAEFDGIGDAHVPNDGTG